MDNPNLTGLSDWTTFNSKIIYSNKHFQLFLNFFLFNCPVEYTSVRSQPFHTYGWQKKYCSVLQRKLREASDKEIKFFRVPVKELYQTMSTTNQLNSVNCNEEVVIYHDSNESISTLFSAIRNAFAHGSCQIKTVNDVRYYCLENRTALNLPYFQREVRARLVLKEETLLRWIGIITSGYKK